MLRQAKTEQRVVEEVLTGEVVRETSNLEALIDQSTEQQKLDALVEEHAATENETDPVCPSCGRRHPAPPPIIQMLMMMLMRESGDAPEPPKGPTWEELQEE